MGREVAEPELPGVADAARSVRSGVSVISPSRVRGLQKRSPYDPLDRRPGGETGRMWANMLRAFQVGKALTSEVFGFGRDIQPEHPPADVMLRPNRQRTNTSFLVSTWPSNVSR